MHKHEIDHGDNDSRHTAKQIFPEIEHSTADHLPQPPTAIDQTGQRGDDHRDASPKEEALEQMHHEVQSERKKQCQPWIGPRNERSAGRRPDKQQGLFNGHNGKLLPGDSVKAGKQTAGQTRESRHQFRPVTSQPGRQKDGLLDFVKHENRWQQPQ